MERDLLSCSECVDHGFRGAGWARRTVALIAMLVLAMQSALLHLPAAAQDAGDAGEGGASDPCDSDPDSSDDGSEDGDEDPSPDDVDTTSDGDEVFDNAEDSGGAAGGDQGDGGGANGDVGGHDSFGGDDRGPGEGGEPGGSDGGSGEGGSGSGSDLEDLNVVSDPIDLANTDKRHVQVDYRSAGAARIRVARVYHSNAGINQARVTMPMGTGWHGFYDRSLEVLSASAVRLHRASGSILDFVNNGGTWSSVKPAGVLTPIAGGWQYVNHRNTIETYDVSGRLVSMSKAGRTSTLQYNAASKLVGVVNPFGRSLAFAYDAAGRLSTVTLPDGNNLTYAYDTRNNLASVRFADGSIRQYVYENPSFPNALTGVVDESARRRLTWSYDSAGRPSGGYYGTGSNAVSITYAGNQVTTTDARGTQRVRTYSPVNGRPVLVALQTLATPDSPATAWTFSYDANGNRTATAARTGESRLYSADSRGRLFSVTRGAGTAQATSAQISWHPTFRKPTQTVKNAVTRNFTIDSFGRVTQVVRNTAAGASTVYSAVYNAQNLLQSVTNARGATTTFTYDAAGNRTSATNAAGQTTLFQNFNAHGQPTRIVRADGVVTSRILDARGRVASRTVAGLTTTYSYDPSGRLTRITAPDGSWKTRSYDAAGNLAGGGNHRSETFSVSRDPTDRIVNRRVLAANGGVAQVETKQFNAVNRLASVSDSRGFRNTFTYANDGRLAVVTDPLALSRSLQYDALDRVVSRTQPNTTAMRQITGQVNVTTTFGRDARNNLSGVVDIRSVATNYGFNAANQRVSESGADTGVSTAVRSPAGDVTSTTDPRGVTLTRSIDPLGRVTSIAPLAGTGMTYAYVTGRGDRLLSQMTDPSGSTTWTYDAAGRLLTKRQIALSTARQLTITRDALGRVSSMTYPSGTRVDVTYGIDAVSSLSINGTTLLSNIAYRPYSQLATGWTWGNGTSYSRTFDADGRIASVTLGSRVRSYNYDAAGRVAGFTDTGPQGTFPSTFSYDEANQLIGYSGPQGTIGYAYDANGNRISHVINGSTSTYTYAPGTNRLTSVAGLYNYTYNVDGNPTSNGEFFTFTYDVFGRISTQTLQESYKLLLTYNGLGQRVSKTVQRWICTGGAAAQVAQSNGASPAASPAPAEVGTASAPSSVGVTPAAITCNWQTRALIQFLYDDEGHLVGEYNNVGNVWQETIWFSGLPVAMVQSTGTYYISADHLGTPRSIVRASDNAEAWRWDSDPFGSSAPTNPVGAAAINFNQRFPGQYRDAETGIHHNGRRDYTPGTGRYLQADPIGLAGGLARYTYVGGNPLGRSDPFGLAPDICFDPAKDIPADPRLVDPPLRPSTWSRMSTSDKFLTVLLVGAGVGGVSGGFYGLAVGVKEFTGLAALWGIPGTVMDGAMLGTTLGGAAGAAAGGYVVMTNPTAPRSQCDVTKQCPRP